MMSLVNAVLFFTAALCIGAHIYTCSTYTELSALSIHKKADLRMLLKPVSVPLTDSTFLIVKNFALKCLVCKHPCIYYVDLWRSDVITGIGRWEMVDTVAGS